MCLPAKSIAKAFGHWRPPLTRVSRAGLITDERYIAGLVSLQSVQYSILHTYSAQLPIRHTSYWMSVYIRLLTVINVSQWYETTHDIYVRPKADEQPSWSAAQNQQTKRVMKKKLIQPRCSEETVQSQSPWSQSWGRKKVYGGKGW